MIIYNSYRFINLRSSESFMIYTLVSLKYFFHQTMLLLINIIIIYNTFININGIAGF